MLQVYAHSHGEEHEKVTDVMLRLAGVYLKSGEFAIAE